MIVDVLLISMFFSLRRKQTEKGKREKLFICVYSCVTDNMEVFLTLAERQYIVKYELDGLRAQRDVRIPGLSDDHMLQNRDNICEFPRSMFTELRSV